MGRMGSYGVVFVLLGWLGSAGAVSAADNLAIEAFYGSWEGTGQAQMPDGYFGLTARDLDVQIGPKGNGFNVTWTTITHPGGDIGRTESRRKSSSIDFVPGGRPGLFKAARQGDPLAGESYIWARIKGSTLTVYVLNIDQDGAYVIQSYDRTLTGFAMEVTFARIRDDQPERTAKAKLIKVAD